MTVLIGANDACTDTVDDMTPAETFRSAVDDALGKLKKGTAEGAYGGSAHRVRFSLDLVNQIDYFHPNVKGQNKLAAMTYPGRFTW